LPARVRSPDFVSMEALGPEAWFAQVIGMPASAKAEVLDLVSGERAWTWSDVQRRYRLALDADGNRSRFGLSYVNVGSTGNELIACFGAPMLYRATNVGYGQILELWYLNRGWVFYGESSRRYSASEILNALPINGVTLGIPGTAEILAKQGYPQLDEAGRRMILGELKTWPSDTVQLSITLLAP